MLVVGWPATVGERSVLVIRPYLYRLNRLLLLALLWIGAVAVITLSPKLGITLCLTYRVSSISIPSLLCNL